MLPGAGNFNKIIGGGRCRRLLFLPGHLYLLGIKIQTNGLLFLLKRLLVTAFGGNFHFLSGVSKKYFFLQNSIPARVLGNFTARTIKNIWQNKIHASIFAAVLYNIAYQERLRVMAQRRLDNLFKLRFEKGANSISFNDFLNGADKSDSKLKDILHHIQSSSDLSGELFYFRYIRS